MAKKFSIKIEFIFNNIRLISDGTNSIMSINDRSFDLLDFDLNDKSNGKLYVRNSFLRKLNDYGIILLQYGLQCYDTFGIIDIFATCTEKIHDQVLLDEMVSELKEEFHLKEVDIKLTIGDESLADNLSRGIEELLSKQL